MTSQRTSHVCTRNGLSGHAHCRRTVTDNAAIQPGEKLDCPSFDCSKKGYTNPMVEIKAGLNVWHQVRVHKETANELCVSYPGVHFLMEVPAPNIMLNERQK